ncbi:tyrosine-type recombinase/integrase [Rhabdochromatium marinum]|uniref:tyrosine-type recombinase/integrase n=1 Tax=Rhabdochromatium marinum TaxID=48729 RepID=UPI001903DE82|nr:site-specific integrase [Rhabdochromatium marinum]
MLQTPPHIASRFDAALSAAGVDQHHQPHFRRWLRFYLDFCHKYGKDPANAVSLDAFEEKLKCKGQAPWMRRQAGEAVALFWSLREEGAARDPAVATPVPSGFVNGSGPAPVGPGPNSGVRSSAQARAAAPSIAPSVPSAAGQASLRRQVADQDAPPPTSPKRGERPSGAAILNWPNVYNGLEEAIKVRHYSAKTLKSYRAWTRKLHAYVQNRAPDTLSTEDVKAFLTFLAVEKQVSPSSQNQAFNALLFLFRHVLGKDFGQVEGVVRAKRKPYIPVVLSRQEVDRLIGALGYPYDLVAKLLYGCGLRLFECLKLRVQDVNMDMMVLTVS